MAWLKVSLPSISGATETLVAAIWHLWKPHALRSAQKLNSASVLIMNILYGEEDPLLLGFPSPSPRSLAENDGAPIIGNELCWNPGLECRPPDDRTRVSVCFAPLDYADQQTCLFQAGKEL